MATNEHISKVVLGTGETLIDLTGDDIKPEHVDKGIIFHDKTGATKTGTSTKTVDASGATAEAAEVLEGKTFGKGSQIVTGTMPNLSGKVFEISTLEPITIPRGSSDGSVIVKIADSEAAKFRPESIKEGDTLLGVAGEYGPDDISAQSKTAAPSFERQVVVPDPGYAFLSSVEIPPIPVTRTDNDAGGVTVTIGA